MADVYQFSQSSLELLELCIAAANQPGKKWIEIFKPGAKANDSFHDDENTILFSLRSNDQSVKNSDETRQPQADKTRGSDVEKLEAVKRIGAILEAAPTNKLDCLIEQCDYEQLLPDLAENLPFECVETICEEILKNFDIQNEKIIFNFFSAFIKRDTSSLALNLLIRGYKMYPDSVLVLIETLFTNTDITNKLLEEFFIAVDEKARSKFLHAISTTEVTTEVFIHHLNTVSSLYKGCEKTFEIHNFVLNGLLQSAYLFQEDKNYGRCLLTFFQGLNEMNAQVSRQSLEKLLDTHKTPFKRPCQAILKNFYKRQL